MRMKRLCLWNKMYVNLWWLMDLYMCQCTGSPTTCRLFSTKQSMVIFLWIETSGTIVSKLWIKISKFSSMMMRLKIPAKCWLLCSKLTGFFSTHFDITQIVNNTDLSISLLKIYCLIYFGYNFHRIICIYVCIYKHIYIYIYPDSILRKKTDFKANDR